MANKLERRTRRKHHIRKRVFGTAERPRLTVFRSLKQIYVQVIDDVTGTTLASASSLKSSEAEGSKIGAAEAVGQAVASVCIEKGIKAVVFDRNGYIYHGRVKAVAEGARKAGLEL